MSRRSKRINALTSPARFTIDALVEMLARAGVRLDIVQLPATA